MIVLILWEFQNSAAAAAPEDFYKLGSLYLLI